MKNMISLLVLIICLSSIVQAQCDSTESEYYIHVDPRESPYSDIAWSLTNFLTGDTILHSNCGQYDSFEDSFDTMPC